MSPAYSYEHDGQAAARRLPHRTSSTRSGSVVGGVGDLPAGGSGAVFDAAAEPDRPGAVPAPGDLLGPPIEVRPPGPAERSPPPSAASGWLVAVISWAPCTSRTGPPLRRSSDTGTRPAAARRRSGTGPGTPTRRGRVCRS